MDRHSKFFLTKIRKCNLYTVTVERLEETTANIFNKITTTPTNNYNNNNMLQQHLSTTITTTITTTTVTTTVTPTTVTTTVTTTIIRVVLKSNAPCQPRTPPVYGQRFGCCLLCRPTCVGQRVGKWTFLNSMGTPWKT